ncbi:hypothetical protein RZS08_47895, partial [Arthrospira platensis SPKY1]|nr:hypothetical protein [Arthrospira platensis SPKY1]
MQRGEREGEQDRGNAQGAECEGCAHAEQVLRWWWTSLASAKSRSGVGRMARGSAPARGAPVRGAPVRYVSGRDGCRCATR